MKMIRFDKQIKQKCKSRKVSIKSRDQKYQEIPCRKIPGLKFLIPLGPDLDTLIVIRLRGEGLGWWNNADIKQTKLSGEKLMELFWSFYCRPGRPKSSSDLFGIEGSFRKLEIDWSVISPPKNDLIELTDDLSKEGNSMYNEILSGQ